MGNIITSKNVNMDVDSEETDMRLLVAIKDNIQDTIKVYQDRYTKWDRLIIKLFTIWEGNNTLMLANKIIGCCPEDKRSMVITNLYLYYPKGPNDHMMAFINQHYSYLDYNLVNIDKNIVKNVATIGIKEEEDDLPSFLQQ